MFGIEDDYDHLQESLIKRLLMSLSIPDGCISDSVIVSTPKRVAKALLEFTSGYNQHINDVVSGAIMNYEGCTHLITIADIQFSSLCEHHLLPFWGTVHISYTPNGLILGLSKFTRIVEILSKRLQLQERLTEEITTVIMKLLKPLNVTVKIEARHACMEFRGAKSANVKTITEAFLTLPQ